MKALKDYIELQKLTGMSDIEIITSYFIDNDIEEEAMEILHNLAKTKIEKMKNRHNIITSWTYTIPSEYLYKKYSLEVATMLHRIELDYIVNGEVTGQRLEWAKENFPTMKMPDVYFMPCVDWFEQQGINFKG
ncbi:MAG: hypothetical protein ACI4S1_10550 [Roseburia sp.]